MRRKQVLLPVIAAILLALTMLLTLTACGGKVEPEASPQTSRSPSALWTNPPPSPSVLSAAIRRRAACWKTSR